MSVLVTLRQLSKSFKGRTALEKIDAELPRGKIIGIAGPDGAGKTTLMRILAALFLPTSGSAEVLGLNTVEDAEQIHAMISYMPQKFGLYEDLTVQQNLKLYAELQCVPLGEQSTIFERLLKFTGLTPFTDRFAKNLSGGMKQKLGLACTLLRHPKLLLLDEPSVGVDPISRRELWKMIHDLLQEGISVILTTAYLNEAEGCDEVLVLREGKLLYQGSPAHAAAKLQGRTFLIQDITGSRRQLLFQLMQRPEVLDAIVQGSAVRILTAEKNCLPDLPDLKKSNINPIKPRFEDAYVALLGKTVYGQSRLAKRASAMKRDHEVVIEAQELTKKFGDFTAADQISFQVKRGEIFGLLGPNGAGKSTTFKMLCNLLIPTSGKAFINGVDFQTARSQTRAQIGYMAQKFSLYGQLTVWQNLVFFAGIYPVPLDKKNEIMREMISIFALESYVQSFAGELPLGYQQRLALACAVMHNPEVLFLDEPTSGVDPITRREFWNHINGLVEKGFTVLVTTHFMEEAEYCDRIGLINRGRLLTIGTPDCLKESVRSASLPNPKLEDAFIILSSQEAKT